MQEPLSVVLAALIFFCGGFVQGGVGFGLAIIAVPAVSLLAGPKFAVALVSIPGQINSLLLAWQGRAHALPVRRGALLAILATGAVGTLLGAWMLAALDPAVAQLVLGLLVLAFVLTERARRGWRPPERHDTALALLIGSASGFLSGLAGVAGPVLAPYVHTLRLNKDAFVAYLNLLFLVFSLYRLGAFFGVGFYTWDLVLQGLALTPFALLGSWLGVAARDRIDAAFFNRLVLIALFVTGLDLLRRGLHLF